MYARIGVPVDNSEHSSYAVDAALALAEAFGSELFGIHVYASKLHDRAFRRMEEGLPEEYQDEQELDRQRKVHDSLIDKGLVLISKSMLASLSEKAEQRGVAAETKVVEGKNFAILLNEVEENGYDLVTIGALGLGRVGRSVVGSVCERVARDAESDVLVLKRPEGFRTGMKILCAIDGSPHSFSALKQAISLSKAFKGRVTAVHVFDPAFHSVAFESISNVLSREAAEVFKFEQQQKLHDEIIDKGLKKVGERHLQTAERIAREEGADIETIILSGKPFDKILDLLEDGSFSLVVTGRFGTHRAPEAKIGSHSYNIMLGAACNHLIVSRTDDSVADLAFHGSSARPEEISWDKEAEERLMKIPAFVRGMARKGIEEFAGSRGRRVVDIETMDAAREKFGF